MTETDPSGRTGGLLDPGASAARMKRTERRFKRGLGLAVAAIVAAPVLVMFLLVVVAPNLGTGVDGALGMAAIIVLATVTALLPGLVPLALVGVVIYLVIAQYRRPGPQAAPSQAPPASGRVAPADEARATAAGDAGPSPADLAADIADLETLRAEIHRQTAWRTRIVVPLAVAGVALFWFASGMGEGGEGSPLMGFLILTGMAGVFAWVFVNAGPRDRYAKAFKERLMPRLLARHGALRYVAGHVPPLGRLVEIGLLPPHDTATGDDGAEGTYRGFPLRMNEIELVSGSGKHRRSVFKGLLVSLEIEAALASTTVVFDNEPLPGRADPTDHGLSRVWLEDPLFDEIYRVFGTDQISARAMLTPATMERLLTMADEKGFYPPYLLAEGTRMVFAARRWGEADLFEPPSLASHDAARQLAEGERELARVFLMVDAMIDMQSGVRLGVGPSSATGRVSAAGKEQTS